GCLAAAAAVELVGCGHEHAGPGAADRVAQGDATAVDVGLLQRVVQVLQGLCDDGAEGLVDLQEVQVPGLPTGLGQGGRHCLGGLGQQRGIRACGLPGRTDGSEDVPAIGLGV